MAWCTALVNAQNGRLDEANATFEQILDPKNQLHERKFDFSLDYVVINELGRTLFDRSKQEGTREGRDRFLRRAVEQFESTIAIEPEDMEAHFGLGQCYLRLGQD